MTVVHDESHPDFNQEALVEFTNLQMTLGKKQFRDDIESEADRHDDRDADDEGMDVDDEDGDLDPRRSADIPEIKTASRNLTKLSNTYRDRFAKSAQKYQRRMIPDASLAAPVSSVRVQKNKARSKEKPQESHAGSNLATSSKQNTPVLHSGRFYVKSSHHTNTTSSTSANVPPSLSSVTKSSTESSFVMKNKAKLQGLSASTLRLLGVTNPEAYAKPSPQSRPSPSASPLPEIPPVGGAAGLIGIVERLNQAAARNKSRRLSAPRSRSTSTERSFDHSNPQEHAAKSSAVLSPSNVSRSDSVDTAIQIDERTNHPDLKTRNESDGSCDNTASMESDLVVKSPDPHHDPEHRVLACIEEREIPETGGSNTTDQAPVKTHAVYDQEVRFGYT